MNNDTDLTKAFTMLDGLNPGEILDVNRLPENRREIFRECAKQYADIYGTIDFNDNYSKIKKLHEWKQPTNEPSQNSESRAKKTWP